MYRLCVVNSVRCPNDLVLLAKGEAACHSVIEWLIGLEIGVQWT